MTDRPALELGDRRIPLQDGETVLEGLLRAGISVASSCRSGHCCSCMIRGDAPPSESQQGLKSTLVEQGYFLSCQARPTADLKILESSAATTSATVQSRELLAEGVLRLRLRPREALAYRPGQFVNLNSPEGLTRSYSLASIETEDFLELHVRRVTDGQVSGWIHDDLTVGDEVSLAGPHGACFYVSGREEQPLLLVGAGTGLAPLWGIARDAVARGHRGPVHLVQGGLSPERLYLTEELRALAAATEQFSAHFCVRDGAAGDAVQQTVHERALEIVSDLEQSGTASPRAFLCGNPDMVQKVRRELFLSGVASGDLLADPFLPSAALLGLPS